MKAKKITYKPAMNEPAGFEDKVYYVTKELFDKVDDIAYIKLNSDMNKLADKMSRKIKYTGRELIKYYRLEAVVEDIELIDL